jgi:hypothetical protein
VSGNAERPDLVESGHRLTVEEIRELTGAATPHFALQLRERIEHLIEGLDRSDPVRIEGERAIARLERIAREGQTSGIVQDGELPLPSLRLEPRHRAD